MKIKFNKKTKQYEVIDVLSGVIATFNFYKDARAFRESLQRK